MFILSHWKQFLQSLFFLRSFVLLKVSAVILCWTMQCTSISEIKCRWKWRPQGLWVAATLACLPRFSIWTDVLIKIQRSIFCILFCQWLAVLQYLPIYLLWITCPKSPAQSAEEEMSAYSQVSLQLIPWAQLLTMPTLYRHSEQDWQDSILSSSVPK